MNTEMTITGEEAAIVARYIQEILFHGNLSDGDAEALHKVETALGEADRIVITPRE